MTETEEIFKDEYAIKRIMELKLKGFSLNEVSDKIKEELNYDLTPKQIKYIYENELKKLTLAEAENMLVNKDEFTDLYTKTKMSKMEQILNNIEIIIESLMDYRDKVKLWVDRLEEEANEYYENKKGEMKISEMIGLQERVQRSIIMLNAGINELSKLLEMHSKCLELMKPLKTWHVLKYLFWQNLNNVPLTKLYHVEKLIEEKSFEC